MNIAPTETPVAGDTLRWLQPVARRPLTQTGEDPAPSPSPGWATECQSNSGSQAPPATDLTKLIAQLSKQLKAIEQTFMRALQSLARSVETAGSPASPPNNAQPSAHASAANPYDGLIRRTAQRHELDPALLSAVIRQESGFDPRARSSAGAMGLMQLMPDTARSLGVADPFDPAQNIEGGARMLRGLIDRYGGRLDLALAAYNAGSGAVDKYGGVPPYAETRKYISSILDDYRAGALGA